MRKICWKKLNSWSIDFLTLLVSTFVQLVQLVTKSADSVDFKHFDHHKSNTPTRAFFDLTTIKHPPHFDI